MKKNSTAIERLLSEGYFETKEAALPFIMSGAVSCGGVKVTTGGQKIPMDKPLSVKGLDDRYVSKGGYKLEGAIADFGIDVKGRICIDAGACTGGFTDCLVKHGAAMVYAVEVGFGQLAGSLAQDQRIVNLEKTNLGDEKLLSLDPPPTLGSVDLSYLSLVKAVPQYREIMHGTGELLCLVKPLFETDDERTSFAATIFIHPGFIADGNDFGNNNGNDFGNENQSDNAERILKIMKDTPHITIDQIVAVTGISKRTVSRLIKELKEKNIVRREGTKNGTWIVLQ